MKERQKRRPLWGCLSSSFILLTSAFLPRVSARVIAHSGCGPQETVGTGMNLLLLRPLAQLHLDLHFLVVALHDHDDLLAGLLLLHDLDEDAAFLGLVAGHAQYDVAGEQ